MGGGGEGEGSIVGKSVVFVYLYFAMPEIKSHYYKKTFIYKGENTESTSDSF